MKHDLFQIESRLEGAEKLALLSFVAQEFNLRSFLTLAGPNLKGLAEFSYQESKRNKTKIDLIYCDLSGYSDSDFFMMRNLSGLLSRKGLLCVDGVECTEELKTLLTDSFLPVLETPGFSIFSRLDGARAISSIYYQLDLFRRKQFFENVRGKSCQTTSQMPLVTVVVLTYNHEQFIAECLNSVLNQIGHFRMRVIVINDASSDQTAQVVQKIIDGRNNDCLEIEIYTNKNNCGVVKNIHTAIRMAVGCDYLTFCEGDDFWRTETRIQSHLDFLSENSKCVISFNTIELCSSDGSEKSVYDEHEKLTQKVLSGESLSEYNWIGNFTACFYDGNLTKIIPDNLFDMYTVDWMFNMYCSQFGSIGHLRYPLSVYRQHEGGQWSNLKFYDKNFKLVGLIDKYNMFLDYQYNDGFQKYKKRLLEDLCSQYYELTEKFDLLIFDDVFPSPRSGFRFTEFKTYLSEFPNSIIVASGVSLACLEDKSLRGVIQGFQQRYPELGNHVMVSSGTFPVRLGKLIYVNFFANAYALLPLAEEAKVPFAFTLYPGGGFVLNNSECDRKLKRIFDSPCFQKVIVTQQLTLDYLINHQLCPADKIELIFGVVMPQTSFAAPIPKDKPRWGYKKKKLDICFMAHRYTPHGEDKGYDVFINAACQLRKKYDNIYFHVIGPYDRRVIDVSPIGGNIEFHGTLNPEYLDEFFKDMDIVMSPNTSGKIWPGSFDGFPTASCTEGGLRGVAIFCTDEFNSAPGRFVDGLDFVRIKYDIKDIICKVEHYYNNPEDLKSISEFGSRRIQDIYSHESQMAPRVKILRDLIGSPFVFNEKKMRILKPCLTAVATNPLGLMPSPRTSKVWFFLKNYSPEFLKLFYRKFIKKLVRASHA